MVLVVQFITIGKGIFSCGVIVIQLIFENIYVKFWT